MKQQTFISKIETAESEMLDFERWHYKRLATVEKNAKKLFDLMMKYKFFQTQVKNAVKIVIYDNDNNPVSTIEL